MGVGSRARFSLILTALVFLSASTGRQGQTGEDATRARSFSSKNDSGLQIAGLEVVVEDKQTETREQFTADYPDSALSGYTLNQASSMKVSFNVSKKSTGEFFAPQQAFLVLTSQGSGSVAFFVAHSANHMLTAVVTTQLLQKQIGSQGGSFDVTLLLGDPTAAGGLPWRLGTVDIVHTLVPSGTTSDVAVPRHMHRPSKLPEIEHVHRLPEVLPPAIIPVIFTGAVLLPLGALLTALMGLRLNVKGFPTGSGAVWATLFHAGIGAILVLYIIFWLQMNLLQIIPPLLALAPFCLITGHQTLSAVYDARLKKD